MKTILRLTRMAALVSVTLVTGFAATYATASTTTTREVTVVNNSNVLIVPTAEGFMNGCVGGSIPPVAEPIVPGASRKIDVVFIKYSLACRFNVLPLPNMVTYPQACHSVAANNTVTFTGKDIPNMQCTAN